MLLRSLREGFDYTTATGRMLAGIFAALAAYERELMHERAAAARAAARARGKHSGRPAKLTETKIRQVRTLRAGGESISPALDPGRSHVDVGDVHLAQWCLQGEHDWPLVGAVLGGRQQQVGNQRLSQRSVASVLLSAITTPQGRQQPGRAGDGQGGCGPGAGHGGRSADDGSGAQNESLGKQLFVRGSAAGGQQPGGGTQDGCRRGSVLAS